MRKQKVMAPNSESTSLDSRLDKSPALIRLLSQMPTEVAGSFSDEQLDALQEAIKDRAWKGHTIDIRPTFVLPFLPWSFYLVFLFGRNKRHLSSSEQNIAIVAFLTSLLIFGIGVLGFILVILYIIKSALGIDIFEDSSLGLWEEFKRLFDD